MNKHEDKVEVTLSIAVDGVKAAARNAQTLQDVVLDLPTVDPKKLSIDDKIYGLKIVPVKDSAKSSTPSTVYTVGVVDINVESLSGIVHPGMVTINTHIDIPKEVAHTHSIEEVYFEDKEAARAVALVFLEEAYHKSEEAVTAAEEIRSFLMEQFEAQRV
jgi:hypothetical protein